MTDIIQIFCDEAGHTGPHLLNLDQKIFSFASVAVSDEEAWALIKQAREEFPVQMPELKAATLMKTVRGRKLIERLILGIDGRYAISANDKILALCGWVFEYIYEPVFHANEPLLRLLYSKNFHRFVAMYTYLWFQESGSDAQKAVEQFQDYMRSLDETKAPLLFEKIDDEEDHPFSMIFRFARGYKEIILADNERLDKVLPDRGAWVLDLSASGLWSHLNYWGGKNKPLKVTCDHSKPLEAVAAQFTGTADDPGIKRAREVTGHDGHLGWEAVEPVAFADSRNHPALQLADIVASTSTWVQSRGCPEGFEPTAKAMQAHVLQDCIFPDFDVLDLDQRAPAVNWLILFDLGKRAEAGVSPYEGLGDLYRAAEISWTKGDFNKMVKKV